MTYKCAKSTCREVFEYPAKLCENSNTRHPNSVLEIYVCPYCLEKNYYRLKQTTPPAKEAPP